MQKERAVNKGSSTEVDLRVDELLSQMTIEEKIGQMTQVEKNSITPEDVTSYFIGSILSGGGGNPTPNNAIEWRNMVLSFMEASLQTRLAIPLIYGSDAVHGHSNVYGATIFPHNIGLGATRSPDLVERIAQATATELLGTNVHWNFAPAVSVPQDIRWGRTYEGFSEDTKVVNELGAAYVRGLQTLSKTGEWVLASVKHFVGDGGTTWDSRRSMPYSITNNWQAASENWRIDQGDTQVDEAALRKIHLAPYQHAIEAGAENIMVSFSSWNGEKMHAHEYLLTTVLKGEFGFTGFLVSDWMGVDQISEDFYASVVASINAGMDMVMVPFDYKQFISAMHKAVQNGDITMERIDDAVGRILRVKLLLGLFDKAYTAESYITTIGSESHRALAREAVHRSLVLLKNNATLPLQKGQQVLVAGQAADDVGLACGGWTVEWQGKAGDVTKGRTLLDGLKHHLDDKVHYVPSGGTGLQTDIGVVVVAETPYAEGEGDRAKLTLTTNDRDIIKRVRAQCERLILVIYSGRPIIITDVVDDCDAIVAAWLPGSEADAIADVLMGDVPFTGKLSFTWFKSMEQLPLGHLKASGDQPLWPFGHGLSI